MEFPKMKNVKVHQILDDAQIVTLAHNIRQKLEKELTYPGQITITVIRETRAVDVAK